MKSKFANCAGNCWWTSELTWIRDEHKKGKFFNRVIISGDPKGNNFIDIGLRLCKREFK